MKAYFVRIISLIIPLAFIFASCNKEVSTTNPELPPPFSGNLFFDSDPRGAKIILNGSNIGKVTPDSMVFMSPGQYNVRFCYAPYLDMIDSINLSEDESVLFFKSFFDDERNFGYIECLSEPEHALIYLNDSCTNLYTPDTLKFIWPGTYEIRCTYPEHRSASRTIIMKGSSQSKVSLSLQDTSESVDYNPNNFDFPAYVVKYILIDDKNVKWTGTKYNGIVKFTESATTVFNAGNSALINQSITSFVMDTRGRKWAGTRYGLAMIDESDNLQLFTTENSGLPQNYITALAFDNDENLWIGCGALNTERFLVKFDGSDWISYPSERLIMALTCDNEDRMWVGLDRGFLIFENEEWYSIIEDLAPDHKLRLHPVESLLTDLDGRIWVGAAPQSFGGPFLPGRLYFYDGAELNHPYFPSPWVAGIYQAPNGSKWITLYGSNNSIPRGQDIIVLYEINNDDTFRVFPFSYNEFRTPHLNCSAADAKGDLWIGTVGYGLLKLKNVIH